MAKPEELFLLLNQLPELSSAETRLLEDQGYLRADRSAIAEAANFMQRFLEEMADSVYQAIIDSVDDVEAFMNLRAAGIVEQHKTFLIIVRYLIAEGRILKKN